MGDLVVEDLFSRQKLMQLRKEKSWEKAVAHAAGLQTFLACLALAGLTTENSNVLAYNNTLVPIGMLVSTWGAAYYAIKEDLNNVWRPVLWYLGACGLYFGFGPLVYASGADRIITALDNFYPASNIDLARTNLLNTIAVGSSLIFLVFCSRVLGRIGTFSQKKHAYIDFRKVTILFLAIGLPVQYFLSLPYRFGLFPGILPGSVFMLDQLTNISLIPLTILAWRGKSLWTWLWLLIGTSQLAIAIIQFSKTAILQFTICFLLGLALRKKSLKMLIPNVGISFLLLILLTSFVLTARTRLSETSGLSSQGTFSERLDTTRELTRDVEFNYSGLNRFEIFCYRCCYVPPQVFVMSAYDSGSRGDSTKMGLYALVPRLLWPEKPVISSVGTQFNALLTGNPNSSSSPGIYGDLYWGGGWIAVLIGSFFVAILLSFLGNYSRGVIKTKQWHLLPVVIMGLTIGYRVDGWLAGDYINPIPIMLAYHLLFSFLGRWCRTDIGKVQKQNY